MQRRPMILSVMAASGLMATMTMGGCTNMDHNPSGEPLGVLAKGGLDVRGSALFVALGKTGEVAVIDLDSWKVAGKVKVSSTYFPHHLGLSPDRTRVSVGAPGADLSAGHAAHGGTSAKGALFIMDSRTGDVLAQLAVSGTAHNVGYLPDNSAVVYALAEHATLHIANPTTLAETGQVAVGLTPLEATPVGPGKLVLVSNSGAGTVAVVDIATKQVLKSLKVGNNPIAAWRGSEGRAFVTSESDRKLSMIDIASLTVPVTVNLTGTPGQALNTADGKQIWVAYEDQGKIAIFDGADLKPLGEISVGKRPHGLALSADTKSFFVTDETSGMVFEVDIAGRSVTRSLELGGAPNGILLRPAL